MNQGGGTGVVLCDPNGVNIYLFFKLESCCSNNVGYLAEHEALVLGFISILHIGIQKLRVQGDSLVIQQINGELSLKESAFVEYRIAIQKLIKSLSSI